MKKVVDRAGAHAVPGNALEIRKENCVCGDDAREKCTFTAVVDANVASLSVDGEGLDLPNFPYANSEEGAASLQEDLRAAVGLAADKVTVTYDAGDSELTITVENTKATFETVNAVAFTNSCD